MENNHPHPHHEEHMDNNQPHHEEGDCCGGMNKCCKSRPIRIIIKIVIILAIIALIAAVIHRATGYGRFDREGKSSGYYGMMDVNTAPANTTRSGYGMMNSDTYTVNNAQPGYGMMRFGRIGSADEKNNDISLVRLFGVITNVTGNQITVMDNGAKEQTFTSSADTTITTSTGEVGLSALKTGQNIILTQAKGKDGQPKLELIQVL